MKKLYLLLGALFVILIGVLGLARIASAYSIKTGDNVSYSKNKDINDTIYAAGRTIDIESEVYGDVFCIGQNINISGTVHGDIICAGQTVNITGKVDGDVRLAAQTANIGADITGNATIGGQSVVLQSNGSVGGDLTLGSQDATLNGKIGRDLVTGNGDITVNNQVGRDIKAQANTMKLGPNARVNGNIALTSENNLGKDKQAVVMGKVTHTEPQNEAKSKHGTLFGLSLGWFIFCFIAMLVTALVLVLLFPRLFHSITDRGLPFPWKALLVGFLATIAVPVVLVILAITVIGIPLAIIFGLAWLVILLLSGPTFAYYLGRLILRNFTSPILIMLLGAALLILLYFIPIIGFIAILAAVWIGTGMILLDLFRATPRPSYHLSPTNE